MKIKLCAVCNIGKERLNNEDAVLLCPDLTKPQWDKNDTDGYIPLGKLGSLLVVADGMGGANAGEVASSIVISNIKKSFDIGSLKKTALSDETIDKLLRRAIRDANEAILKYVTTDADAIGLGTTIVILWLINGVAHIAWCGDSRCYLFNADSGLKSLTKDHSYIQELLDKGEIKPSQMLNHVDSNVITRCLGDVDVPTEPDIIKYQVAKGDTFLLCSDGLCGYCKDSEIEKVIYGSFKDLGKCSSELLGLALNAGGYDNITIALCSTLPDNETTPRMGFKAKMKRMLYNIFGE